MEERKKMKPKFCEICNEEIVEGYGNNGQPVERGLCCNSCNTHHVIPARLKKLIDKEIKNEDSIN